MLELALVGPEAASGGRLGGGRSGHEPLSVRADVGGPPRVADRLPFARTLLTFLFGLWGFNFLIFRGDGKMCTPKNVFGFHIAVPGKFLYVFGFK